MSKSFEAHAASPKLDGGSNLSAVISVISESPRQLRKDKLRRTGSKASETNFFSKDELISLEGSNSRSDSSSSSDSMSERKQRRSIVSDIFNDIMESLPSVRSRRSSIINNAIMADEENSETKESLERRPTVRSRRLSIGSRRPSLVVPSNRPDSRVVSRAPSTATHSVHSVDSRTSSDIPVVARRRASIRRASILETPPTQDSIESIGAREAVEDLIDSLPGSLNRRASIKSQRPPQLMSDHYTAKRRASVSAPSPDLKTFSEKGESISQLTKDLPTPESNVPGPLQESNLESSRNSKRFSTLNHSRNEGSAEDRNKRTSVLRSQKDEVSADEQKKQNRNSFTKFLAGLNMKSRNSETKRNSGI